MKKLLASALLAGLFLGTTSPVFAATIPGNSDQSTGTTFVNSAFEATYTVTIPDSLSIDLAAKPDLAVSKGNVVLSDFNAAGSVAVTAIAKKLALLKSGTEEESNAVYGTTEIETIPTSVFDSSDDTDASSFDLTNYSMTKSIIVKANENSNKNLPGTYKGTIEFTFDYIKANPE